MKLNTKIVSSVAGASIILTLLGIFGKGIGFIREIIYANNFGLSSEFDLFLSSVALPNVINTAVIYLCQHYFVPSYSKIKKESESAGIVFFNYTFWWFVFGGIVLAIILYIVSGLILHSYLASISFERQQLGIKIFTFFLITIPINAGMSVIMAYQQANFKFITPAVSLIVLNIVVIILILLFSEIFVILILPLSFVAAYSIAFIFLVTSVKNDFKFIPANIFKIRYRLSEMSILISLIFIEGLSLSYVLIDRYFIGKVSEGGIAALNYAFVLYSLPISLFSIPLITTMFSKFSNSPQTLQVDYRNSLNMNFFIMVPSMFILFFWGNYFLQIFYERGNFSSNDTIVTYSALQYYSISLIFLTTYSIIVKILYSISRYTFVLIISSIAFFLKIILNIYFVEKLEQNGLALSTTLIFIFLLLTGYFFGIRKMMHKEYYQPFLAGLYFILNALLSLLCGIIIDEIFSLELTSFSLVGLLLFSIIYLGNSYYLDNIQFNIIRKTVIGIFR